MRRPSALGVEAAGDALGTPQARAEPTPRFPSRRPRAHGARPSALGGARGSGDAGLGRVRTSGVPTIGVPAGTIRPSDSGLEHSDPRCQEYGVPGRARRGRGKAGSGRDSAPATPVGSARPSRKRAPRLPTSLPTPAPPRSGGGARAAAVARPPGPGGGPDPERFGAPASWPWPRGQRPEPVPRPRARPSRGAPGDAPAARSTGSRSRAVKAAAPPGPAVSGPGRARGGRGALVRVLKFGLGAYLLAGWKEAGFRPAGAAAPQAPATRAHPDSGAWVTQLRPCHSGALRLHPDCRGVGRGRGRELG